MTIDIENVKSKVWYEKYRPKDLKSIMLPTSLKTSIRKYINMEEIPCLLFHSVSPGVGKTSLAYIICNEIDADYIYFNASLDNGIDVVRTNIERFATSASFTDKPKIVILDEFGGSSRQFQEALNAFIENFTGSCRFIFTCNNLNKIYKPIRSRCQVVNFDYKEIKVRNDMYEKIVKQFEFVLKSENVVYEKVDLVEVVRKYFPDMRKMYNILQGFCDANSNMITKEILSYKQIDEELIDLIMAKKLKSVREYVIKLSYNYLELYRFLYDKLIPRLDVSQVPSVIVAISEFSWREYQGVNDSEINFAHCLLTIMQVL